MKQAAKVGVCLLYKYSGVLRAQEFARCLLGTPFSVILLVHRVTDAIPEDGLTVTTGWFRGFCRLMSRSFHVVSLAELHRQMRSGEKPKARTVAITFDDCYRDNLFAARVLAEHGLPACFFVPTAFVGTDHVFPWDEGLPRMPNLSWDDVRDMASLGHEIGSHTATHPNMAELSQEQARLELKESRDALEQHVQRAVRFFAYPFGGKQNFRDDQLALVQEAGYEACLSGHGGFLYAGRKEPILPREAVPYFRSLAHLELYLRGGLRWYYALQQPWRGHEPAAQPAPARSADVLAVHH